MKHMVRIMMVFIITTILILAASAVGLISAGLPIKAYIALALLGYIIPSMFKRFGHMLVPNLIILVAAFILDAQPFSSHIIAVVIGLLIHIVFDTLTIVSAPKLVDIVDKDEGEK